MTDLGQENGEIMEWELCEDVECELYTQLFFYDPYSLAPIVS